MTSEQEKADLAALKEACAKERESAFWMCREILRADPHYLKTMGHSSIEAGLRYTIEASLKTISKLDAAFFRKYPDK